MFSQDVDENDPSLHDIQEQRPRDVIGDVLLVEQDTIIGIN